MIFKRIAKKVRSKISKTAPLVKLAIAAILLLVFTIFVSGPPGPVLTSEQIEERVEKFEEVKAFKDQTPQIKHLDRKGLLEQAKKYPVIYNGLNGDIYEVRYSGGNLGTLLLYDAKSDKILKIFNLLDWKQ